MVEKGIVRSFQLPNGRRIVSIKPEAMRIAVKAAMATRKTTAKDTDVEAVDHERAITQR